MSKNQRVPLVVHASLSVNGIPRNDQTQLVNALCNELVNTYHVLPHPEVVATPLEGGYTHYDIKYTLTHDVVQEIEWRLKHGNSN